MKPGLQTSLGQHLSLTPQLRQALALLQMSWQELEHEMAMAVETNPLLEWAEPAAPADNEEPAEVLARETTFTEQLPALDAAPAHTPEEDAELPDLSPWESASTSPGSARHHEEASEDIAQQVAASESLHDHLDWQLRLARLSGREHLIGQALIDAIDDDGYLRESFAAIKAAVHPEITAADEEISTVLHRIQCFDPAGVGARDLPECLILQLAVLPATTPALSLARRMVSGFLDRLPRLGSAGIAAELGCPQPHAEQALALLRSLDPHPGAQIGGVASNQYLTPDCTITRIAGVWQVGLTGHQRAHLSIHHGYEQMIGQTSGEDHQYLRRHLQEARWLLKGIKARGETLLKVVACIVRRQSGFLEHGPAALLPLTLREVADEIGLHESTVSRAVAHKYAQTPRGTLALKEFFASGIETGNGGSASSTAISQMLRALIDAEPPHKPLSDARLTRILNDKGIPVARRTVAKYREASNIPASHERRRLG